MPKPEVPPKPIAEQYSYNEFLHILRIEFGEFFQCAESGRKVRYNSYLARKQSMRLRHLLKIFRELSLRNDKLIEDVLKEAEARIDSLQDQPQRKF